MIVQGGSMTLKSQDPATARIRATLESLLGVDEGTQKAIAGYETWERNRWFAVGRSVAARLKRSHVRIAYQSQCNANVRIGIRRVREDTGVTTPEVGFVSAALCLRPPRVAILVADDEHWRDWAMLALATASDYWGGVGFILVPFDKSTGEPSSHFAEVVRAYDPDHG